MGKLQQKQHSIYFTNYLMMNSQVNINRPFRLTKNVVCADVLLLLVIT